MPENDDAEPDVEPAAEPRVVYGEAVLRATVNAFTPETDETQES